MVAGGTLSPHTDWTQAFTTRFTDKLDVRLEEHA